MIKHVVLFQFHDPEECIPTAREKLHSMVGKIPEICSMETGADFWHGERSYDLCLIVTFRDRAGLKVYDTHPYHQEVRKYIYAHRKDSRIVDFETDE